MERIRPSSERTAECDTHTAAISLDLITSAGAVTAVKSISILSHDRIKMTAY